MSRERRITPGIACLTSQAEPGRNGCINPPLAGPTPAATMRDFMALTKALADENRVRMLLALRDQELCLCQIIEVVALAPSTVSKHMSILRQARFVEGRKDGRWVYYRLAGRDAPPPVRQALDWAQRSLADDPQVKRDRERLQEILQIDPEQLCRQLTPPGRSCSAPRRAAAQR